MRAWSSMEEGLCLVCFWLAEALSAIRRCLSDLMCTKSTAEQAVLLLCSLCIPLIVCVTWITWMLARTRVICVSKRPVLHVDAVYIISATECAGWVQREHCVRGCRQQDYIMHMWVMVLKYIHFGTELAVNVVLSIWSVIPPVHRFNIVYFAVT